MIQIFVVGWGAFFGGKCGEIGKKCVTLHFDELKPPKKIHSITDYTNYGEERYHFYWI